jgi:hypothetical protein
MCFFKQKEVPMKRIFILLLCMMLSLAAVPASAATADQDVVSEKNYKILSCDTVDGWTVEGDIALDTEDKTEGQGCVSFTVDALKEADCTISIEAKFNPVAIRGANILSFDFYISDPTLLWSTYILTVDLGSSATSGNHMLDWPADAFSTIDQPGWYHVELPFEHALNLDFNDGSVNFFRLYLFHVNPAEDLVDVEIKIDNIEARAPAYRNTLVESCDTPDGWSGGEGPYAAAPVIDRAVKKQGLGSLYYEVNLPQQIHLVSQKVYATPINVAGAVYVEMDVYVSDVKAFENCGYAIQFEITSSGTCDHQEYCWSLDKYVTKSGWTHIRLPISDASFCQGSNPELAGPVDLSRINYFRFHTLDISQASNNQFIFRVDNISFTFPAQAEDLFYGAKPIGREDDNGGNNGDENGSTENEGQTPDPNLPEQGGNTTDKDKTEKELRARQTAQRAKILLLLMTFAVIGVDVVVMALRRRREQQAVVEGELPPDTEG